MVRPSRHRAEEVEPRQRHWLPFPVSATTVFSTRPETFHPAPAIPYLTKSLTLRISVRFPSLHRFQRRRRRLFQENRLKLIPMNDLHSKHQTLQSNPVKPVRPKSGLIKVFFKISMPAKLPF